MLILFAGLDCIVWSSSGTEPLEVSSSMFSASLSKWPHGADRILPVLVAWFAFSQIASAQALIHYHQHLLMPTEESPQGFLASDLVKLLDEAHFESACAKCLMKRCA